MRYFTCSVQSPPDCESRNKSRNRTPLTQLNGSLERGTKAYVDLVGYTFVDRPLQAGVALLGIANEMITVQSRILFSRVIAGKNVLRKRFVAQTDHDVQRWWFEGRSCRMNSVASKQRPPRSMWIGVVTRNPQHPNTTRLTGALAIDHVPAKTFSVRGLQRKEE